MTSPIRILSVDDHAFLVAGLKARFDKEPDLELVGHVDSANGLLPAVREHKPDIVLLDIEMPGGDPFEALDDLRRAHPDVRAILLSAYVRDHYIDQAYKCGAWGYLSKSDASDAVVDGIRRVARGELAFSPEVLARTKPETKPRKRGEKPVVTSRLASLTDRELQLLRMMAKGMSRTDIAEELCRSPMTVDNHRKSIMKKLEINDRAELVRFAIAEGLVEI